jgi:hypothetical protein
MRTPEKIAFAGDWHADAPYALTAVNWAKDQGVDTMVHVGDFGYRFVDGFSASFIRSLTDELKKLDMQLYFVDGNHDNHEFLASLPTEFNGTRKVTEQVVYMPRGLRWTWGELDFLALGGAYSVDKPRRIPGQSWWPGETISYADYQKAVDGGKVNILISHDCPDGVAIPGLHHGVEFFGQEQIDIANHARMPLTNAVIETEPNAVFCGHFHVRHSETIQYEVHDFDVHILNCNGNAYTENMYVATLEELKENYA